MVTKFLNIDTDSSLTANSNERVPSQKAIKTYTDGKVDVKQDKTLATPIVVGSEEKTTVESALQAINTSNTGKQNQSLSSAITVNGTSQTTVEGALNAINLYADTKQHTLTAGDNITITNNTISASVPEDVYTATNLIAGRGVQFNADNAEVIITNMTTTSYIRVNDQLTFGTNPFSITVHFKTANTIDYGGFLGKMVKSYPHLQLGTVDQNRAEFWIGSSDYGGPFSLYTQALQTNTEYWLKAEYTGSAYNLYYGQTKEGMTLAGTSSVSAINLTADYYAIGSFQAWSAKDTFNGTIYLSDYEIIINGTKVFDGSDPSQYTIVGTPTLVVHSDRTKIDTTYVAGSGISITEDSDENLVIANTQTSAEWGNITGTLSNQTDLQNALNTKYDTSNPDGFITAADLPTNYVTTDTTQNISARKTFLGEKAIYFKQETTSNKLGFTLYDPNNTELGALEYRPNTINGGGLLNINMGVASSNYVGFRYWASGGGTATNIIAPKAGANYYIPVKFTDGTNEVSADSLGEVDLSSIYQRVLTAGSGISITEDSDDNLVISATGGSGSLPDPTGHSGEFLTTDGTDVYWDEVPSSQPTYNSSTETITF